MSTKTFLSVFLLGLGLFTQVTQAAPPKYALYILQNPFGGDFSAAYAINNRDDVVGNASGAGVPPQMFAYNLQGGMKDLGNPLQGTVTRPEHINLQNMVVGSGFCEGNEEIHAFTYSLPTAATIDLGNAPGFNSSCGQAINDNGQCVGYFFNQPSGTDSAKLLKGDGIGGPASAFIFDPNQTTFHLLTLNGLGGTDTKALDINNKGVVVGGSAICVNGPLHAFRTHFASQDWSIDRTQCTRDLGVLEGFYGSQAHSINDSGRIVGVCYKTSEPPSRTGELNISANALAHAFVYSDRKGMQDLGGLNAEFVNTVANGINNQNQIVGFAYNSEGQRHGFVTFNHKLCDLNDLITDSSLPNPSFIISSATSINDHGWIVGFGNAFSMNECAVVLVPVP